MSAAPNPQGDAAPNRALINFNDEDLNGACFIAGSEGELDLKIEQNVVLVPPGFTSIANPDLANDIRVTPDQANAFVKLNVAHLINNNIAVDVSAKVSYLRLLTYRLGLCNHGFSAAAHFVRYNHCEQVDDETYERLTEALSRDQLANIRAALTDEFRTKCRINYTDYICCVAYIFRVRGHHYKDEYRERYDTLWSRCLKTNEDLVIPWQHIATIGLHAVMPIVLDNYWRYSVENALCAGTLIKRFDSAPAGCAGVSALQRGLTDVMMLFPGIVDRVPDSYRSFIDLYDRVNSNRWGGSVNSRFYGVARIRVDESRIGALASVVMGIYEQLAEHSRLRESPALRRLAEIAPATGGALGQAALRTVKSDRLTLLGATEESQFARGNT